MISLYWLQCGGCGGDTMSLLGTETPDVPTLMQSLGVDLLWHPSLSNLSPAGQAQFVVAIGTCASFGGFGADGEIEATGLQFTNSQKDCLFFHKGCHGPLVGGTCNKRPCGTSARRRHAPGCRASAAPARNSRHPTRSSKPVTSWASRLNCPWVSIAPITNNQDKQHEH